MDSQPAHPAAGARHRTPVLLLGMFAAGLTLVTAWLSSELVSQVRVSLDDDRGVIPFAPGARPVIPGQRL